MPPLTLARYHGQMTRTEILASERARRRIELELESRTLMLLAHGGLLLAAGLMMALTGAPRLTEEWFGPWARLIVGPAGMILGISLFVGVALTDDSLLGWRLQKWSTTIAGLWHLGLSGTFLIAAVRDNMELLGPGEQMAVLTSSRGYVPFVYVVLGLLVCIHTVTLWRLGRPPR